MKIRSRFVFETDRKSGITFMKFCDLGKPYDPVQKNKKADGINPSALFCHKTYASSAKYLMVRTIWLV